MANMKPILCLVLLLSGLAAAPLARAASLEWHIPKKLALESPPLDVAVSLSGKRMFVLTEKGEVQVHSPDGTLIGTIAVGHHVDRIRVGPREDLLLLVSRQNRAVETLVIDFIHDIDTAGSPFKGPDTAPVSVVVFSDFQ